MTIPDQIPDSHNGKKLEKSLDAVAALRQAMEQRLAAARVSQVAAASLAMDELLVEPDEDDEDDFDTNPESLAAAVVPSTPPSAVAPAAAAPADTSPRAPASLAASLSAPVATFNTTTPQAAHQETAAAPSKDSISTSGFASTLVPLTSAPTTAASHASNPGSGEAPHAGSSTPSPSYSETARAIEALQSLVSQVSAPRAAPYQSTATDPTQPTSAPASTNQATASPHANTTSSSASAQSSGETRATAAGPDRSSAPGSTGGGAKGQDTQGPNDRRQSGGGGGSDIPPVQRALSFDPIVWTRILIHVTEGCQKLIRDYLTRMRDKPMTTMPFTPTPIMESMSGLAGQFLADPEAYTQAQIALWQNYLDMTRATIRRLQGFKVEGTNEPAMDKRFQDKDWQNNWMFDFIKQSYLTGSDGARKLVQRETSQIDKKLARKIEFYTRLFLDATAPSNFWLTNPEVVRATLDSGGDNLIKGFGNLLEDLETGNGMLRIRMSDYAAFEIGKNVATTPGKVIYQNDLMQLIQYSPSTATVRQVPILIVPPWINKFYILDLREKNSYIRYLVGQGFTVFCISWVNPTKRHALTQFEDYVDKGAIAAMREVKRVTGEDEVNTIGYCIGGTALACTQAYIAAHPEPIVDLPKIKSATYLVTMVDFSNPGDLGVFIDEDQIRMLEDRMARQGYLDAGSMALTFNLLRANDLIWPFVINNYLLGREPFPFDILYWNMDSTNLPAAMQSYYLRKMYLDNKLVEPDALKMKGMPIDLREITTPSFILATRDDHIAPWRSTYAATQLYKGPVTFVLSGSGHIAGVVNAPVAEKYGYWINADCPPDPEDWVKNAEAHQGSWWPQWINWLDPYSGGTVPGREVAKGIEDAPGSYVKVRAI